MGGTVASTALKQGFEAMVKAACDKVSKEISDGTNLTEHEKQGVRGLLCESMTFLAKIVVEREVEPIGAGIHLITNGISLTKLTPQQQIYCGGLKAEIGLNAVKLAGVAAATYTGAVAGANAGVVAGGITGTVVAGPAGTIPGVIAGGVAGAGGPLLVGSYKMYEQVAKITDLAIDYHSQCGPLAMDKAPPTRTPVAAPRLP